MPAHMPASTVRPRWPDLPADVKASIERLAGGRVMAARNCADGFSSGFGSLPRLEDGRRAVAWAAARLGAPFIDLLSFLSCVSGAGSGPEPVIARHRLTASLPAGLAPILTAKVSIGVGALGWLAHRIGNPL